MDLSQAAKNQRKWENFLSTIKAEKKEAKPPITITKRKAGIQCLAYDFAHKLLADSNSTVTVTGQRQHVGMVKNRTDLSETFVPSISKSKSFPADRKTEKGIQFSGTSRFDTTVFDRNGRLDEKQQEEIPVIKKEGSINITGEKRSSQSRPSEHTYGASKPAKCYKPSMGNDQDSNQIFHKPKFRDQHLGKVDSDIYDLTESDVDIVESKILDSEVKPVVLSDETDVRAEPQKPPEFKTETCIMDNKTPFEDVYTDVKLIKGDKSKIDRASTYEDLFVNEREFEAAEKAQNVNIFKRKDDVIDPDFITEDERKNDKRDAESTNFVRNKIDISKKKDVRNQRLIEKEILQEDVAEGRAKDMIKEEIEQDVVIEIIPHLTSKISAESVASIEGDIDLQRQRERNKPSPRKVKKDIDISCSRWTMVSFAKYFDFDSTVSQLTIPLSPSSRTDVSEVQKQISNEVKKRCKVMFETNSPEKIKDFFKGMRSNEITVRILVDAIFLTLCSRLGYRAEVGKEIKSTILIPCEFDYRILHKGHVIGSIETKSSEGLRKVSIIQAVLQLTILQAEVIQSGMTNIPPLFNIVTDGVRYVFIQLKGEKLQFEQTSGKLHINRVESIEDLEELVPKLVNLVRMSEDWSNEETCESDGDEVLDLT